MTARIARLAVVGFLATAVLGSAGCSSKSNVSGKVTVEGGKPVTSGSVSLVAQDNMQYAGTIGPDGGYSIPNVPSGTVKILVSSPNPDTGNRKVKTKGGEGDLAGTAAPAAAPAGGWFPIPDRYGDLAATDLKGEVKGESAVLNVELKSK